MSASSAQPSQSGQETPQVVVIIVTCNSGRFIEPCLSSLNLLGADIAVVDNGSTDETKQIIRQHPQVKLIESPVNVGYGKGINLAVAHLGSKYRYLILSNADVVYQKDTIAVLISLLDSNPGIGIAAPQQVSTNGGWQVSYADVPGVWSGVKDIFGINSMSRWYRRLRWPYKVDRNNKDVGYLAGAVLAVSSEAFFLVNGFDESFRFYGEDADLCIRLRAAGRRVVFCPAAEIIHHDGGHSTKTDQAEMFCHLLTKGLTLLAEKHLPRWKARVYLRLRSTYYQEVALILRIVKAVAPKGKRAKLSQKIRITDAYSRL